MKKVQVLIMAYNEEQMLPYTLRHYTTFADRILVFDGGSTDRTLEICREYGAQVVDYRTDGLNDRLNMQAKNQGWINDGQSDWIICVDTDEIVYFPNGAQKTLEEYDRLRLSIVKTRGYEMLSDTLPTTKGQIYEELYMGAKEDKWYSKPILFSPRRLKSISFAAGAHTATGIDLNGHFVPNPGAVPEMPAYLLHYHHIGPIERLAARYDATRARLSSENVKNRWGNFDAGMKHALDKRALILPGLHRVV